VSRSTGEKERKPHQMWAKKKREWGSGAGGRAYTVGKGRGIVLSGTRKMQSRKKKIAPIEGSGKTKEKQPSDRILLGNLRSKERRGRGGRKKEGKRGSSSRQNGGQSLGRKTLISR